METSPFAGLQEVRWGAGVIDWLVDSIVTITTNRLAIVADAKWVLIPLVATWEAKT